MSFVNQHKQHSQNENRHFNVANSRNEKLLGVKFDSKLTFDDHISELCKKTKNTCIIKSNTIHEYFEKAYSYECVFQITI